jgi:anti-sigma regulatory factor (Ser/Thr protein kinase)
MLPHAPASVGVARQMLRRDLCAHAVPEPAVIDAVLVLNELLTNAIRHARALPGGQVRAAWRLEDGWLELTVTDGGGPGRPRVAKPPPSAPGGRGLSIIEQLCHDWGVRDDALDRTVWTVLPAGPDGSLQPASRQTAARAPSAAG